MAPRACGGRSLKDWRERSRANTLWPLPGHLESKYPNYSLRPPLHQVYHECSWAALRTLGSLGYQLTSCPQHSLSWAVWGQSCTGCRLPSRKPLTFTTW